MISSSILFFFFFQVASSSMLVACLCLVEGKAVQLVFPVFTFLSVIFVV